ncbi:septal ring lytic transglycosylase RlpA family protein [Pseudorhodoferax sp.]|uniref:septal ring lytic transglycosylase RlpA family protein n=1 Tax=Pseudorhodoferax sp. TaxID=1993553 RepID=UPI003FA7071B
MSRLHPGGWPLLLLLALAGCSTVQRDGPGTPPPGLERLPDALPRVEPLRVGGPNKPYEVLGRRYTPAATDIPWREAGLASWYGAKFHGRPTANGERYDMYAMTAAHKTLPLPSYARVRNPANGREVVVRVNDRGPFVDGRVIDLSYAAALRLGLLAGVAPVEVERLTHEDIRSGRWRRQRDVPAPPAGDALGELLVERGLVPGAEP